MVKISNITRLKLSGGNDFVNCLFIANNYKWFLFRVTKTGLKLLNGVRSKRVEVDENNRLKIIGTDMEGW